MSSSARADLSVVFIEAVRRRRKWSSTHCGCRFPLPGRIAKVLHREIALAGRVMRANAHGQPRMDAVMYLSSALEANRALEAEGPIHSTGAGSSRAWVRARRQGLWFEHTKLNHLVYIIPVDKLDFGCAFLDR